MSNNLLTAQEVADILKVKKSTVYEMIKRGEIPSHKIGKQLRIASDDIDRFFAADEKSAPPPARAAAPGRQDSIVLCGQDVSLDIIANYFSAYPQMPRILRSHAGSYNSLYQLYHGKADIATTHLWDEKLGVYNIPYVERLLPGMSAIVIRLFGRMMGFYVQSGNPKGITGWEDLRRRDIKIVNREKGSGTRVLLDEKLKALRIAKLSLDGYVNEQTSHLSVAGAVSGGEGDMGLGVERIAAQVSGVDFIPVQKEWYDMVFFAEQADEMPFKMIIDYVSSEKFMMEIMRLGNYDFSQTGKITRI